MPRVKTGVTAHRRHKKVLALTKGQRATRHALYRRAHESMLKSLSYAYSHRRERKGDMRRLWTLRINAASNRKMIADLAVREPELFAVLVSIARG